MKTLSKEQTKNIMYQLYADRIGSKENLTFDERFNRDRAIIKVLFERWGMEPEENDKLAGSLALMYRRVFKTCLLYTSELPTICLTCRSRWSPYH